MVWIPEAIERKIPHRAETVGMAMIFPAISPWKEPGGLEGHHHLHESILQRAVKSAAGEAGLDTRVTCHTFCHSFAMHVIERGHDIHTVQELLGHRDVTTTMIYTHVLHTVHAACQPTRYCVALSGTRPDRKIPRDGSVQRYATRARDATSRAIRSPALKLAALRVVLAS